MSRLNNLLYSLMYKVQQQETDWQKIIVIGSSAGGRDALTKLLSQLPANFPAPIIIVQHIATNAWPDAFTTLLSGHTSLICETAKDGVKIQAGHAYLAPADHHLLITNNGTIMLTKGAPENRSRPAVDPLFRSAAIAYGTRVIAIILTGYLDDGTSGLIAVQRCGGTTIIQDPNDASYPDMPKNALSQMVPDYCIPLEEMSAVIITELEKTAKKSHPVPKDIQKEAGIAKRVLSDLPAVNSLGEQVPFNCPGCGGVLWKMVEGDVLRYRCHVGHAYTAESLHAEQNKKIEETMWTALRMFEERRNLLMTMAEEQKEPLASLTKERAAISQVHIDRIRAMLLADEL